MSLEQTLKLPLPLPSAASPVATKTTRTFWLQSLSTSWDPAPLSPPGQAGASYFRANLRNLQIHQTSTLHC